MAPYEALYGRPSRSPICWTEVGEKLSTDPDLVRDACENVDLIWKRLLKAQIRQKSYADRRQRPLEFEVGDHVFLNVMPKRGMVRFDKWGKLRQAILSPSRYSRGWVQSRTGWRYRQVYQVSCCIPCLHVLEVHSRSDSCSGLGRTCC